MVRSIIRKQGAQISDERLGHIKDLVAARLAASLEFDGHQPIDMSLLLEAARTASSIKDPARREAVMRYVSTLHEPCRTIFLLRRGGWTSKDIATFVGMEIKPVCRALAKMYVEIKQILDTRETSV